MTREMLVRFNRMLLPLFAAWGISSQCVANQIVLPAGLACAEFGITIDLSVPDQRVEKHWM